MTLLANESPPLEEVWVALDLETTGLSLESDEIIEIGAVKFRGRQVLETYQTFVNPHRRLDPFITSYTGISQEEVDRAPPFSAVAGSLASFIGTAPVVGHNVAFDLGFLANKGLSLPNPRCDTWDMAYVLHPELPAYSLGELARSLDVAHTRPHRGQEDAIATKDVFIKLTEELSKLDVFTLAEMQRVAARSRWVMSYLLGRVESHKIGLVRAGDVPPGIEDGKGVGVAGVDTRELSLRLRHGPTLRPEKSTERLDPDFVASALKAGGSLSQAILSFEERPEQVAMARAVADAINESSRLIVEAGTGVGKSLAYLLPAALYALSNNKRVVVSTDTINLQEQLLNKDLPLVVQALADSPDVSVDELKFTQLKGRANYLCLRRWQHMRSSETISEDEARLLAKTLVWLQTTATGDRSELNLGHRSAASPWERLSAQGALQCQGMGGPCFLRAARERAAASHIVVVNHALLLSDLTAGGSLIPDYDVLIVDEAHHLEQQATRHLGFELAQARFEDHLQSLAGDRGLLAEAVTAFRGSSAASTRRNAVEEVASRTTALVPAMRDSIAELFGLVSGVLSQTADDGAEVPRELRITGGIRTQPAWSEIEIQSDNVDVALSELDRALHELGVSLEGLDEAGLMDYDAILMELFNAQQVNADLRERLAEFISHPKEDGVYWVTRAPNGGDLTLHSAPLNVGETLDTTLFSQKDCVVLTSATLSANGTFAHIRERTGFADADELLLGSPFDFPRAALLCVPNDMPEPSSWAYQEALEEAIADAAIAADGRTMALFTSHASLQAVASAIRANLQARGITVLAQAVDGTPPQLARRFLEEPRSVLLGTASFWEGVDFAGEALKVLLVARLPFNVPTEPVFAARSEVYEDPFGEYAVPEAVLRLRQGFGRLIRTKTDKGVAVILDRRVTSRRYGRSFLEALPPVTMSTCDLHQLADEIKGWLGT